MGKIYNTQSDSNIFKKFRKKIGMTQEEVAKSLNLVTSTISKWETGKTIPDQSILPKLASLYKCSIDDLFNNENNIDLSGMQILHYRTSYKNTIVVYDNSGDKYEYNFDKKELEHILKVCEALTADYKKLDF